MNESRVFCVAKLASASCAVVAALAIPVTQAAPTAAESEPLTIVTPLVVLDYDPWI